MRHTVLVITPSWRHSSRVEQRQPGMCRADITAAQGNSADGCMLCCVQTLILVVASAGPAIYAKRDLAIHCHAFGVPPSPQTIADELLSGIVRRSAFGSRPGSLSVVSEGAPDIPDVSATGV